MAKCCVIMSPIKFFKYQISDFIVSKVIENGKIYILQKLPIFNKSLLLLKRFSNIIAKLFMYTIEPCITKMSWKFQLVWSIRFDFTIDFIKFLAVHIFSVCKISSLCNMGLEEKSRFNFLIFTNFRHSSIELKRFQTC